MSFETLSSPSTSVIEFWDLLSGAFSDPTEADLTHLWQKLEDTLVPLTISKQLQVAGEAIASIARLFGERSNLIVEELEATGEQDPVMPEDAFDKYVRKTMDVDFDRFVEPPPFAPRNPPQPYSRTVVGEVDKKTLLDVLAEDLELTNESDRYRAALEIAHHEDITQWVEAINKVFQGDRYQSIGLVELANTVDYSSQIQVIPYKNSSLVQTWIAVLLGGFVLEQRGDFYETSTIWILPNKNLE